MSPNESTVFCQSYIFSHYFSIVQYLFHFLISSFCISFPSLCRTHHFLTFAALSPFFPFFISTRGSLLSSLFPSLHFFHNTRQQMIIRCDYQMVVIQHFKQRKWWLASSRACLALCECVWPKSVFHLCSCRPAPSCRLLPVVVLSFFSKVIFCPSVSLSLMSDTWQDA